MEVLKTTPSSAKYVTQVRTPLYLSASPPPPLPPGKVVTSDFKKFYVTIMTGNGHTELFKVTSYKFHPQEHA